MTEPAITCDQVTRAFSNGVAVDELTLEVPRGSVLALLGHNGAGKTTTIRLLNGVLAPDSGSCRVLGLDPARHGTEVRRRTGVVTENAGLDDRLTARENLAVTARLRAIPTKQARARIDDLLERFDMTSHADQPCQGFSTGQRRRIALARALVHDPEILFLDEPTSGLDPSGARGVMDLIETSARERGRTVVLCTHFLAEAGSSADLMAVMHRGRLLAFGRPESLAAQRWPGLEVHLDLGGPPSFPLGQSLLEHPSVTALVPVADGAVINVTTRDDIPGIVALAVGLGATVYGTQARPKGLEDVFFAVQAEMSHRAPVTTPPLPTPPFIAAEGLDRDDRAA